VPRRIAFADLPPELLVHHERAATTGDRIACRTREEARSLVATLAKFSKRAAMEGPRHLRGVRVKWTVEAEVARNGRRWWDIVGRRSVLEILKEGSVR